MTNCLLVVLCPYYNNGAKIDIYFENEQKNNGLSPCNRYRQKNRSEERWKMMKTKLPKFTFLQRTFQSSQHVHSQ